MHASPSPLLLRRYGSAQSSRANSPRGTTRRAASIDIDRDVSSAGPSAGPLSSGKKSVSIAEKQTTILEPTATTTTTNKPLPVASGPPTSGSDHNRVSQDGEWSIIYMNSVNTPTR